MYANKITGNILTGVIPPPCGKSTILIKDKKISITHANCHDSLCVDQGSKSKVGDSIVCLPHKVVVSVVEE